MVSTNFLAQKTIRKKNIFPNFWFQEMSLKREIFVNFLPQKIMKKYGIVLTYSVTFVFWKILACLQCHEPDAYAHPPLHFQMHSSAL